MIEDEKKAIENLRNHINDAFSEAVERIFSASGRVVVTGIGKSANIATKIVSTLNSTGTPALFMHAADAIHGDLGMIRPDDVVICISKSGNTPEIKVLVPLIKNFGNTLIAIVGNCDSFLARPHLMTDTICALATAPGGALGKQLYLRVSDLYIQNERPEVPPTATIDETILEMTSKRLGCTVVTEDDHIKGIITDGDLRRMMQTFHQPKTAADIMHPNPRTILDTEYAVNALQLMRQNSITQLIVVDADNRYLGIIHIHDILREGII